MRFINLNDPSSGFMCLSLSSFPVSEMTQCSKRRVDLQFAADFPSCEHPVMPRLRKFSVSSAHGCASPSSQWSPGKPPDAVPPACPTLRQVHPTTMTPPRPLSRHNKHLSALARLSAPSHFHSLGRGAAMRDPPVKR